MPRQPKHQTPVMKLPKKPEIPTRDGWIDTRDVARIIRYRLACLYPRTRFSVRIDRYAGGSSIDVRWTDGPPELEVNAVVKPYASSRFDGSIDLGYSVSSWLRTEDLTAIVRSSPGSAGSGGYDPPIKTERPPGCIPVRFGSGYVQTQRSYTAEAYTEAQDATGAAGRVARGTHTGAVYFHGETRDDDQRVWLWLREKSLANV